MSHHLNIDEYVHVNRDCPIRTEVHPADDFVEIILGELRFNGNTLRLVINDPDTLVRITETLGAAHVTFVEHLHRKSSTDPAVSQEDSMSWVRTGS